MRDPIVSNVREGLPPCMLRYARFGESVAFLHDYTTCEFRTFYTPLMRYGIATGNHWNGQGFHPFGVAEKTITFVDNKAEAQAAFERGAEWVRTGEMA